MDKQELRDIFATELERCSEHGLARMVRSGADNSHGGTAAIAAMEKVVDAVLAARNDETRFVPKDAARAIFSVMEGLAGDIIMDKFFELWETEGDPLRAGSMVAHAYIRNAARIAAFGARCANLDPRPEVWLANCEEQFRDAIRSVDEAFPAAAEQEQA